MRERELRPVGWCDNALSPATHPACEGIGCPTAGGPKIGDAELCGECAKQQAAVCHKEAA